MPTASPSPAFAVATGPPTPELPVELCAATLWLSVPDVVVGDDVVAGADVVEAVPLLDSVLAELVELEDPDVALGAHEACVGTSTPTPWHRPLASLMMATIPLSVA